MTRNFYIASWSGDENRGIYALKYDFDRQEPVSLTRAAEPRNTTYFARRDELLYALSEIQGPGDFAGELHSFRMTAEGGLEPIDSLTGIPTGSPHLALSADGRTVYTASYNNGKVCSARTEDGRFGAITSLVQQTGSSVNAARQEGPHAHIMCPAPDGGYVVCCDLGTDELNIYALDEAGALVPKSKLKVPAGYGPRHMLFSADGEWAYVVCELKYHVLSFHYDGKGGLSPVNDLQVLPELPEEKNWGGAVKLGPRGLLFTTNRPEGRSTLDALSLENPAEPKLRKSLCAGEHIRDFLFTSEDGKDYLFALSMTENLIRVYAYDREAVSLTLLSEIPGVEKPVCIIEE